MSEPQTTTVEINGFTTRVWSKGSGPRIGFLAGFGGQPRWTPFLDALAERHTVIVPSLPGFPGGETGHKVLDSQLDWLLAVRDLLAKAGLEGCDLVGSSVGGALAADFAALWPGSVRKLVLIAPFGLFDEADPAANPWAQTLSELPVLLAADPEKWKALVAAPDGANSLDWQVEMVRASEAAARLLWPLGNTGLARRLHLIQAPTLLLWGAEDRLMPRSYAERLATGIAGPTRIEFVAGAGHLAQLDRPREVADCINHWVM